MKKKSIALLLALVFTMTCCLSSCERPVNTQPPMTDEELQAMPLYTTRDGYDVPKIAVWKSSSPELTYVSESRETVDFYGESYSCAFAFADHLPSDSLYRPDTKLGYMKLYKYNDALKREILEQSVCYDYETSEVLYIDYLRSVKLCESFKFPEDLKFAYDNYDAEAIEEVARDFIEEVLNDKYNKGIDIDNYEFWIDMNYGFALFRYYINGVVVHWVSIGVTFGSPYFISRWSSLSVPPDDVLRQIPNITPEQYKALVEDVIIQKYVKEGETVNSFSILNLKPLLFYTSEFNEYLILIQGNFSFERENGEIVSDEFDFAIRFMND